MSLSTTNFEIDLLNNVFKSHPMLNYKFYIIIENVDNYNKKSVGMGFKYINLLSSLSDDDID